MRRALLVLVVLGAVGCGIKAPPKPPLEVPTAPAEPRLDGGCCRGAAP